MIAPAGGRIEFDGGAGTQTVSGTNGTNYFNEFEVNSSSIVQPTSALRIDGGLLITSGELDVNAQTLDVNAVATLSGGVVQ